MFCNTFIQRFLLFCHFIMFSAQVSSSVVDHSVDLSLNLMRQLYSPSENLVFSPYSIMAALLMTLLGASGNSRLQLLKILFGSTDDTGVRQFISEHHQLTNHSVEQLLMTNLIFPAKKFSLKSQYRHNLKSDFSAIIKRINFADETSALKTINSDVSHATRGMIPRLVTKLDPSTVLVLINTVYFNAKWAKPFDRDNTNMDGIFVKESGKKVKTPIMNQNNDIPYYEKSGTKAVLLAYNGSDISMVLILPPERTTINAFVRNLKGPFFDTILHKLSNSNVENIDLTLPRFKVSSTHDKLVKTLENLGVRDIFSPGSANLSMLTDNYQGLYVSQIIQKATIECNEKDTKAAAATEVGMMVGSAYSPIRPREFNANRPFVYVLVRMPKKKLTKQVLFMGVLHDPRKE